MKNDLNNSSKTNKYKTFFSSMKDETNKSSIKLNDNNILDQNDFNLNEEFNSLIILWDDLGVTKEFQKQFKNSLLPLLNEEKLNYIQKEKIELTKFRNALLNFTKNVSQRENNIFLLKKYSEIININNTKLNDIPKIIENLRIYSVNCVNSIIKLRSFSYYNTFNGKFNFNNMNKAYIYNDQYLIKMKNDLNFLYNSNLQNYIDFSYQEIDPFLVCCSISNNNIKQNKIVIPINDNLMEQINQAKFYLNQDLVTYNNLINNNNTKFNSNNNEKNINNESNKSIKYKDSTFNLQNQDLFNNEQTQFNNNNFYIIKNNEKKSILGNNYALKMSREEFIKIINNIKDKNSNLNKNSKKIKYKK